jgi:hypothetical protein
MQPLAWVLSMMVWTLPGSFDPVRRKPQPVRAARRSAASIRRHASEKDILAVIVWVSL